MRSSWLYLATRSERHNEPVLIWVAVVATGAVRIEGEVALHGLLHAASLQWNAGAGPASRVHGAVRRRLVIEAGEA